MVKLLSSEIYLIENDCISVSARAFGAEINSVRSNLSGREYLWQGDKRFWGGQSPLLFPNIGMQIGDYFDYKGISYPMAKHGFARKSEFVVETVSENELTFLLRSTSDTLKIYPFEFELRVIYRIEGFRLFVDYDIKNCGTKAMLFSIGGHPAFNCPYAGELERFYLLFDNDEELISRVKDGLLTGDSRVLKLDEKRLFLNEELFENDALIMSGLKSKWIEIRGEKSESAVRVNFQGFPFVGIWSAKGGAPFVCIEPWFGVDSTYGDSFRLEDKEGIVTVDSGHNWRYGYFVEIKEHI